MGVLAFSLEVLFPVVNYHFGGGAEALTPMELGVQSMQALGALPGALTLRGPDSITSTASVRNSYRRRRAEDPVVGPNWHRL